MEKYEAGVRMYEESGADQTVLQFREIMKQRKENALQRRMTGVLCVISLVLMILSISISITTMNSYERMKQMERTLATLTHEVREPIVISDIQTEASQYKEEETDSKAAETVKLTEQLQEDRTEASDVMPEIESQNNVPDTALDNADKETEHPDTYVVKKGDNLSSISRMIYGTEDRVDEICEWNHITDKNVIMCGQELKLPK